MRRQHIILATLFIILSTLDPLKTSQAATATVAELKLPHFEEAAVKSDHPFIDIRIPDSNTVLLAGKTSLWRWQLSTNKLQRVDLVVDHSRLTTLRCLGTDGLSEYAATDDSLYQVLWHPQRVLKFALSPGSKSLGFTGSNDNLWLVQSNRLMRIDRYGRSLILRNKFHLPDAATTPVFDQSVKTGWYAHKEFIYQLTLDVQEPESRRVAKFGEKVMSLQYSDGELLVRTKHTLTRMGADGKVIKLIPIANDKELLASSIDKNGHLYFFSDQNLEVYIPELHWGSTVHLPIRPHTAISHLSHFGGIVAFIADGLPRIFRLTSGPLEAK